MSLTETIQAEHRAFRRQVEAFLKKNRLAPSSFGREAVGDPSFVFDLRLGRTPRPESVDRVRDWMRSRSEAAE